jgi:hypothetical protein
MKGFWFLLVMNMLIFILGAIAGWCGKALWEHHMKEKGEEKGENEK